MYKAQHPLGVELNKLILHMNDNNGHPFYIKDDWMMNYLKTLVYSCSLPRKGDILFSINN